jgi:hypothetical protein
VNIVDLDRLWAELASLGEARSAEGAERTYAMGPATVRVNTTTAALARWLSPALEHREKTAAMPDFSVVALECPSSRLSDGTRHEIGALANVGYAASGRFRAAIGAGGASLQIFDIERSVGIYWVEAADWVPPWERAAPYRCLAAWGLEAHGVALAHAAALSVGDQAVLVTGPSGRGKSTIALGWANAGKGYLADDFVAVSDQTQTVYGLYRSAKVFPDDLRTRFSALSRTRWGDEGGKAILLLDESVCRLPSNAHLRAVVALDKRRSNAPRLARCAAKIALLALAPSSLLQVPGVKQGAFSRLASLLRSVPTYELTLSQEREANIAALRRLLEPD